MTFDPSPLDAASSETVMLGLAPLLRMACSGIDLAPLRAELVARAERDLTDTNTLLDLSTVLLLTFNREDALAVQSGALAQRQLYRLTPPGVESALRLLVLKGPGDLMANTPIECLLEGSDVALTLLYVGPGLPLPASVPEHDALFVAIGENDDNRPLLGQIGAATESWPRPVINRPAGILLTSRDAASEALANVAGVVMPETRRIGRSALESKANFPIIIRPAGSHAGQGLVKADDARAVTRYLQDRSEAEFYVAPFVDYRSADGLFRKYRLVLIEGQPFVSHVGISENWMIHYANAGMAASAAKRDEEARIMADFDEDFGRRHEAAIRAIHTRIGLHYLGIDCAETIDGRLVVFEVDPAMVVHDMDPIDVFPYKIPQMRKIFAAFRDMLNRAGRPPAR